MSLSLTFPGGQLKTVAIGATAGNSDIDFSPGSLKRWRVLYGAISLTTDGTVANRTFRVKVYPEFTYTFNVGTSSENIPASTTGSLTFGGLFSANNRNFTNGGFSGYPAFFALDPESMILEGSDVLRISIINGVAGDSFSGFIRVLEFGGA